VKFTVPVGLFELTINPSFGATVAVKVTGVFKEATLTGAGLGATVATTVVLVVSWLTV
jgi:hypothetical protein